MMAPVGWGHLLRCFWYQVKEMYGLAQLGHLKQPRSPACVTNNEQAWLNYSVSYGSDESRLAKLQTWLKSSARSATSVRWWPRRLELARENMTSWIISSLQRKTWPAQPSLRSRASWANDMGTAARVLWAVNYGAWQCWNCGWLTCTS